MILVVDNSKNGTFTPQLLELLKQHSDETIYVCARLQDTRDVIESRRKSITRVILYGSPVNLTERVCAQNYSKNLLAMTLDVPVLGVCFGAQVMSVIYGSKLKKIYFVKGHETCTRTTNKSLLLEGVPKKFSAYQSHGDSIVDVPVGFRVCAVSDTGIQAIESRFKPFRGGVQFHLEASESVGEKILCNFLNM